MTIDVNIADPRNEETVHVDEHAILNVELPAPPLGENDSTVIFRQFFTDDGTKTGSEDMTVDGSVTEEEFKIVADQACDRYISNISFSLQDMNMQLDGFGGLLALTNGVRVFYSRENVEIDIEDKIETNGSLVRLCLGNPAFGNTTNVFKATVTGGGEDSYLPVLDFRRTFGLKWGLRLKGGAKEKISIVVRDNLTGITAFNAVAYGFDRICE